MTPVQFIAPGQSDATAEEIVAGVEAAAKPEAPAKEEAPLIHDGGDLGESTAVEFISSNPNHRTEVGTVTVADVRIDPRVQRPENLKLTRKISRNLVLAALGTVTISVRENQGPNKNETWYILLDGQQRMIGSRKAGYTGPIRALFHFGLSLQEEAELFLLLNDKVDVPAASKYTVGLTGGLADVVLVQQVLDQMDIKLGNNPGQFNSVVVARRVVAMPDGAEAFRWALRVVKEFYPQDETPKYEGRMIEALARLKVRHGNLINTKSLIAKVLKMGGPVYILQLAKLKKETNRTTSMVGMIEALIQTYNAYLQLDKGNRLPDWDRTKK
jgi:hypothetical protein